MALLTEDAVRSLASYRAEAPVTTCYLDVDGRTFPSHGAVQREYESLVRRSRARMNGNGSHPSVEEDLRRIERHVKGFDRSGAKGLAIFSCSSAGFWEVHELPLRVTSQLVVHHGPYVRQLEGVVDELERFGVLLVDKQRARMFVYELGVLVDHSEVLDEIQRGSGDDRGAHLKTRQSHQEAELVQAHARHAAELAFAVFQKHGFDRLLLGGTPEVVAEVERIAHPYLRERLADRVNVTVGASDDQIRKAAHEAEERSERTNEARLVAQLREEAGAKARGVTGLAATIAALNERRVECLLVSHGYEAEGWRCASCLVLATIGRTCPACGKEMTLLGDVVEEVVEEALAQHCRVELCVGNADLDVAGRIGALLRY